MGFRYVDPVAHRIYCYYEAESLQGIAVPLTAYDILCVRLTSFVRLPAPPEVQHSIRSGEFDPPRRGLAPRKIRAPAWRTNAEREPLRVCRRAKWRG